MAELYRDGEGRSDAVKEEMMALRADCELTLKELDEHIANHDCWTTQPHE